jgi:uncharacterized membrane protein YecN with MAPEG domain
MNILSLYAGLFAIFFVILSILTIRQRRKLKIGLGDGGNDQMFRAVRVHSNFAEYVPLSLILIFLVESRGAEDWLVHSLCLGLLIGRIFHAFGVSQTKENFVFRVTGMAMTLTSILSSAFYLLFTSFKIL